MSIPALRPAARMRPVLRACLERQRGDYWGTALGLAVFAGWLRVGPGQVDYVTGVFLVALAGLIPALPHERRPVWDAAMPVDPAAYALVHLVCGIVHATILLAVTAGLHVALFADPEHPGGYPLALFAWGLTWHLLLSAAFLLPRPPTVSPVRLVVLLGAGVPVLLKAAVVDPAEFLGMTVWEVLARTTLPLGFASAAAYVALRSPARPAGSAGRAAGQDAPRQGPAGAFAHRPAPRPVRRSSPLRPPAARTIFRRHFALLWRVTIVPALTLLVFAAIALMWVMSEPHEAGDGWTVRWFVESPALRWLFVWMAVSWAALVWLREHGAQRRWNDALPVGTGKRRVLHAAAGAAWLLLIAMVVVAAPLGAALAAGTLASPAGVPAWFWLGLPVQTLTLYLAATLVLFGTRLVFQVIPSVTRYVVPSAVLNRLPVELVHALAYLVNYVALLAAPFMVFLWGIGHLETLALAMTGDAGPHGWSYAASALRLVVYAAAAAGAIALNDSIRHLDRLPTLREVRGLLPGRAGTRPGPPLRAPAAP